MVGGDAGRLNRSGKGEFLGDFSKRFTGEGRFGASLEGKFWCDFRKRLVEFRES
jgi:hypothetical protein